MLKNHSVLHRNYEVQQKKITPKRIAAVRTREMMAIISMEENLEDAEGLDIECLDVDAMEIPQDQSNSTMPVININDHMQFPWK